MKELTATDGTIFIVDDEDFDKLSKYSWYNKRALIARQIAVKDENGKVKTRVIPITHDIFNIYDKLIDHKDRDFKNNQKSNLRLSHYLGNSRNRSKNKAPTSSQYKGVYRDSSRNLWVSKIRIKKRSRLFLGRFENEIDAAKAYDEAALKYHKEFACINFP